MTICEYVNSEGQRCADEASVECRLPVEDVDGTDEFEQLCSRHAIQSGYCCCCGEFWAGVDAYDFSRVKGVCPNCIDELNDWEEDEDGGLTLDAYYWRDEYADDALDTEDEQ